MSEDFKYVSLTKGKFAKVDAADYEWLSRWKWSAHLITSSGAYYARGFDIRSEPGSNKRIYMHRLILGLESGDRREADHWNHDTLDNRRLNLRLASSANNKTNRRAYGDSGYKGVRKQRKRWRAEITINSKNHYLGLFITPEEAHAAYCAAATLHYGEFACVEGRNNA